MHDWWNMPETHAHTFIIHNQVSVYITASGSIFFKNLIHILYALSSYGFHIFLLHLIHKNNKEEETKRAQNLLSWREKRGALYMPWKCIIVCGKNLLRNHHPSLNFGPLRSGFVNKFKFNYRTQSAHLLVLPGALFYIVLRPPFPLSLHYTTL